MVRLVLLLACCLGWAVQSAAAEAPSAAEAGTCAADAAVQQLAGPARDAFMTRCAAGRTPPIADTANAPLSPDDPAEVCNARAVGDQMTGEARKNYVDACVRKAGQR